MLLATRIAISLLAASLALAQNRGTLRGVVTDPTGAAVPNAAVTAKNSSTGFTQTAQSGQDGVYSLLYLPAGTYTLKYRLRANVAGTFRVGPATLQSLYAPEFVAYSAGAVVRVAGERD